MRRRILAGLVLAVIVITAVVFVVTRSSAPDQGPLVPLINGRVGFGVVLHAGQTESISGPFMVRNTSDKPVVLDRIEPVGVQDGLDFLGAYALSHANGVGYVPGYQVPPNGRALPGPTVPPNGEVELVLGVRQDTPGRHGFTSLDIVYHDGAAKYRQHAALSVVVCSNEKGCRH